MRSGHAQASKIEAEITYGERLLRLSIRDDGKWRTAIAARYSLPIPSWLDLVLQGTLGGGPVPQLTADSCSAQRKNANPFQRVPDTDEAMELSDSYALPSYSKPCWRTFTLTVLP